MKRSQVTIKDVASRAGVSYQTVSRVLNAKGEVSDETRARVQAAIDDLDYRPDAAARSLASRRTHVIGLLTADFSDYTHARIIEGAEAEARRQGFLISISGAERGHYGERLYAPLLAQRHTEGLFVGYHGADGDTGAVCAAIPDDVPIVSIGFAPQHPRVVTVGVANVEGGRLATAHLLGLGHRRVATITGPTAMYSAQERLEGYRAALTHAGLWEDAALITQGDWRSASGYTATLRLLDQTDFSALFAQNDRMAMGALQALRERGVAVPDDVAVVGFDDIPSAPYFDPPLTTVHQPTYELGQLGVRLLIDLIHGQPPASSETPRLPVRLVVRRSCGAPRQNQAMMKTTKDTKDF